MIKAALLIGFMTFLVFAAIGCFRAIAALEWLDRLDQE